MANPTTYFSWVMPNSADLVTDLPADFAVFGQGVDTSMQYLLGGTTGQVLSKTSATNMAFTWVTPTDQVPLTTKGDLFTFTTVDARLGVGSNNQTLYADSTASTGLAWGASAKSTLTTTGDILYASAANTPARLGIGTTGQVLNVSGGIPAWTTATSGGLTSIASGSLSGASLVLSSISGTYKDLRLILSGMTFGSSVGDMGFKANAITDYAQLIQFGNGNTSGQTTGNWGTGGSASMGLVYNSAVTDPYLVLNIFDYASTVTFKSVQYQNYYTIAASVIETVRSGGWIKSTAAVTSITITPNVSFTGGTYVLYGVN